MLTHQEQFGAFLVSGHRGAGKSSFVEYCLAEYDRMAFQRSIRISRGARLSGVVGLFLIALVLVTVYALLTQFLELGAQNIFEAILAEGVQGSAADGLARSSVLWILGPFFLGSLLMLVPGYLVLRTATAVSELQETPWGQRFVYWATMALLFCVPATWILVWQLAPEGLISKAITSVDVEAILSGFVWVLIPLMTLSQLVRNLAVSGRFSRHSVSVMTNTAICLAILAGLLAIGSRVLGFQEKSDDTGTWAVLIDALSDGLLLEGRLETLISYWLFYVFGCQAFQALFSRRRNVWFAACFALAAVVSLVSFVLPKGPFSSFDTWKTVGTGFYQWCQYLLNPTAFNDTEWETGVGALLDIRAILAFSPMVLMFVAIGVVWAAQALWIANHKTYKTPFDNGVSFAPVRTILVLKGNFMLFLSLLGLLPFARVILGWAFVAEPTLFDGFFPGLPNLESSHVGISSFGLLFAILVLIYRCEYNWIARDQRSFRQDSSMGRLGRARTHPDNHQAWQETWKPKSIRWGLGRIADLFMTRLLRRDPYKPESHLEWAEPRSFSNDHSQTSALTHKVLATPGTWAGRHLSDQRYGIAPLSARARYVYRQLEIVTLPYWIYSIRYPVLKVWINLGFDNLEHSRIVEAMLRRLRDVYRSKFIGLTSVIGGLNATILLTLAVLTTSFLSKSVFHIGNMNAYDRPGGYVYRFEGNEVSSRQVFGATNYCGFFEVYPEIAPVAKSLICALPFSNGVMELLYSPVLEIHTDFQSEIATFKSSFGRSDSSREAYLEKCHSPYLAGTPLVQPPRATSPQLPVEMVDWSNCLAGEPPSTKDENVFVEFLHDLDRIEQSQIIREQFVGRAGDLQVGNSEVVRFMLDRNLGLPLIDFTSSTGPQNIAGATAYRAFSPHNEFSDGSPTLRVYHLLLYVISFLLFFTINRRLRILPYQANVDAMNELILLINGKETLRSQDQTPGGWMAALWPFRSKERSIENANDPRVIEQRFIELLNRMKPHQASYNDGPRNPLEILPEITFVFDEMDKLSGIVDPSLSKDAESTTHLEENSRERARSLQLHQLLSDMKRLISGHSARFIFIGGRLYHDEWLADQAQRAPILNSIFSGQIYLTSLLADRDHSFGRINERVVELITLIYRNARHRLHSWRELRKLGPFSFSKGTEEPTYLQFDLPYPSHPRRLAAIAHATGMEVVDAKAEHYTIAYGALTGRHPEDSQAMSLGQQETLDQLTNFLTYRSAGNPKKLKELLQSLVQTSSYALALHDHPYHQQHKARWSKMRSEGHDVLMLDDNALYRMQFIDMLYRHLMDHTEGRMLDRDDKVSMSIFYLMDFLMKFHNRGFSRTNLQRVDELSHIHRAPDLRSVMSLLVEVSSERFLHRVLNGVHTFRFRSDFAREIDYLSRISKEEMATLNFTLDESQSLKGLYQQTINTGERENIDTIAGLGELYEYDQEYEIARNYYRRAIAMLDSVQGETFMIKAVSHSGRSGRAETDAGRSHIELRMLGELLSTEDRDRQRDIIQAQIHWVIARLRLMLQIGQTYEQEQNFERAAASYMHAARFSDVVLDALSDTGARVDDLKEEDVWREGGAVPLVAIRNQAIFYQGGFAAAWVLEKERQNIDDSVVYAESWLRRLYDREPLLYFKLPMRSEYRTPPPFSGGILLQASLGHDRLGDLYFMKGQQSLHTMTMQDLVKSIEYKIGDEQQNENTKRIGYLGNAQYHYAMSLWMLRKYLTNRFMISGTAWTAIDSSSSKTNVFDEGSVTSSQFHTTLADGLTDLAEVILARRSALRCSADLARLEMADSETSEPSATKVEHFQCDIPLVDLRNYSRYVRRTFNTAADEFNKNLIAEPTPEDLLAEDWIVDREPSADILASARASDFPKGASERVHRVLLDHLEKRKPRCGNYKQWLGQFKVDFETTDKSLSHHVSRLDIQGADDELSQLYAYKFFGQAAARASQKIGQSTNTANEYFLQADALNRVLWDAKAVDFLQREELAGEAFGDRARHFSKHLKKQADTSGSDEDRFHIGLLSLTSIQDAIERIQLSDRPSATRLALNHGNPKHGDGIMAAEGIVGRELQADYDLAQAFRDEPRGISLACSLVLALLQEDSGPLCTALALMVYKDILMRFANETFSPVHKDKDGGEIPSKDELDITLRDALADDCLINNKRLSEIETPEQDATEPPEASYCADEPASHHKLRKALFRATYAGLGITLERYRFPILNRLNGLKVMADALLLQSLGPRKEPGKDWDEGRQLLGRQSFYEHFGTSLNSQIARHVREMNVSAGLYGSELHFPADRPGTTMALTFLHMKHYGLHAIYDDNIGNPPVPYEATNTAISSPFDCTIEERVPFYRDDDLSGLTEGSDDDVERSLKHRPLLSETVLTREAVGEFAFNKLSRSQESFSMGDAYYENIDYLNYLNDDFNDRSIHYYHASAMSHADLSEVLALLVKEGISIRQ
ncbi:hypothetical protein [Shimia ponticola]|uniref:hypothetical protein n=1 Tax=Shimia ponticola TaxID=2582893 RepID=UPI001C9A73C9|nr:hypothetical protein [Shimia ponticola]